MATETAPAPVQRWLEQEARALEGGGFRLVPGGVTAPAGFRAAGAHGGIKARRPDVALVVSDRPAAAAGAFTRNPVRAAPVELTQGLVSQGRLQAVVITSGNANACTGPRGEEDARATGRLAAEAVGLDPAAVGVCATGVIGVPLPMAAVARGVRLAAARLGRGAEAGRAAAEAIMTTDAYPKTLALEYRGPAGAFRVGGMAKGAGMIHPRLATTLAVVTTDARLEPDRLRRALARAVARSFSAISVDGDTSPSDSVLALANGAAGPSPASPRVVADGLARVLGWLARAVVADGEGASTVMEVRVTGAPGRAAAARVARAITRSVLVKAALFGRDPNWGRILVAAGTAGVPVDTRRAGLRIGHVRLFDAGAPADHDEAEARAAMDQVPVVISLDLGSGGGAAVAWGSDLTRRYLELNAAYRT